jgi:hypothetical protein
MSKNAGDLAASAFKNAFAAVAENDQNVRRLFAMFHGSYGNLFLSKFQTGEVGEDGKDKGLKSAMKVWGAALIDYTQATIEEAYERTKTKHVEFPPSLPQFLEICAACKPREAYKPAPNAIGMSQELRSRYAAQARAINERHALREIEKKTGYTELPPTLDGLFQAVALAVSLAGGDEAVTLLNLEKMKAKAAV